MMGFFLLVAAGNDSTKATYCSGMRALMENPDQRQILLDDPSLIPSAVEESLRMFPAFAHFRRTATCDTELNGTADPRGREGRDVVRVVEPRRDALRGSRTASTCAATPSTRRSAPAAATSASGTALARLELQILLEETLDALPGDGDRGQADAGRVAVPQPAEDAAGAAVAVAGARRLLESLTSSCPCRASRCRCRDRRPRSRCRRRAGGSSAHPSRRHRIGCGMCRAHSAGPSRRCGTGPIRPA